jgi:Predicted glycosyltransferases
MGIAKIFVIIVTYKGQLWYDRCFSSFRESEIPLQTLVIDNASNDGTVEYIKEHYPEIHVIASEVNLGFGQGNNKGMRYALDHGADYVFLLNQDAWIEPNTLKDLIEIHTKNPEFGIISPMHLNADKTAIEKGLINYVADLKITDPAWINDLYFGVIKEIYNTNYVNAAAWLLPRKTLETIGGFDPLFFHYGEDDNYLQRVIYHGMKIGICPKVRVVHDTERRLIQSKMTTQDSFKNLLVELCNINNAENITNTFFFSIRKSLLKALRFNLKLSNYYFSNALFVFKMRKLIVGSKANNKIKQTNWL